MRFAPFLLAALAATPALGQDEAQPADDSLTTSWQALQKEYNDAVQEFYRPWREARAKGEDYTLDQANHPNKAFAGRFQEFADGHKGTDGAAQALVFVMRIGGPKEQEAALHTLLQDYMGSKAMKDVAASLRYRPDGVATLRTIVAKSPHAEVQGFALLTLGQALKESDAEGALAALEKVAADYADLPWYRGTLGEKAKGEIHEVKHLSVGKAAPEVAGEDIDGVAFKLADYRGMVVLLDFWGDW